MPVSQPDSIQRPPVLSCNAPCYCGYNPERKFPQLHLRSNAHTPENRLPKAVFLTHHRNTVLSFAHLQLRPVLGCVCSLFEKTERLGRILNGVIKLHPVIVFKFKRAVTVFDKVIPSVFIEAVQSGVLKSVLIQPYTGQLINA